MFQILQENTHVVLMLVKKNKHILKQMEMKAEIHMILTVLTINYT